MECINWCTVTAILFWLVGTRAGRPIGEKFDRTRTCRGPVAVQFETNLAWTTGLFHEAQETAAAMLRSNSSEPCGGIVSRRRGGQRSEA